MTSNRRAKGLGEAANDYSQRPADSGRRHAKLEPHRAFLLARIVEKDDIAMPELAAELAAVTRATADPSSLLRWLIRAGHDARGIKRKRLRSLAVDFR